MGGIRLVQAPVEPPDCGGDWPPGRSPEESQQAPAWAQRGEDQGWGGVTARAGSPQLPDVQLLSCRHCCRSHPPHHQATLLLPLPLHHHQHSGQQDALPSPGESHQQCGRKPSQAFWPGESHQVHHQGEPCGEDSVDEVPGDPGDCPDPSSPLLLLTSTQRCPVPVHWYSGEDSN